MKKQNKKSKAKVAFDKFASKVTKATGTPTAFFIAALTIVVWAATGPLFHYSDTWQLVINTGTTIVTFLMVFVIQQSQNKDTVAIQLKLNELIACNRNASNRLIDIEDLTDEELQVLKKFYIKLSRLSQKEMDIKASHSLEEAMQSHTEKVKEKGKQGKPKTN